MVTRGAAARRRPSLPRPAAARLRAHRLRPPRAARPPRSRRWRPCRGRSGRPRARRAPRSSRRERRCGRARAARGVAAGASTSSRPSQSRSDIASSIAVSRRAFSGWPPVSCSKELGCRTYSPATNRSTRRGPTGSCGSDDAGRAHSTSWWWAAGAAGLYSALTAADAGSRVAMVLRKPLSESSSYWAQGGLAAAIGPDDSTELHVEDTVAAGRGACRRSAAELLAREAPGRRLGAPATRHPASISSRTRAFRSPWKVGIPAGGSCMPAEPRPAAGSPSGSPSSPRRDERIDVIERDLRCRALERRRALPRRDHRRRRHPGATPRSSPPAARPRSGPAPPIRGARSAPDR